MEPARTQLPPRGTPLDGDRTPPGRAMNSPGITGTPPGITGTPPGITGTPPGITGPPPGITGITQGVTGITGTPPSSTGPPPATTGTPSGITGTPPGITGNPPGMTGTPPGITGTPSGITGTPPGVTGITGTPPSNTSPPPDATGCPPEITGPPQATTAPPPHSTGTPPDVTGTPPATTGTPLRITGITGTPPGVTGTPPESTGTPPGVTGTPPGITGPPPDSPNPPPDVTGPPSGITGPPSGITGPPSGITEPPSGITEPPSGITGAPPRDCPPPEGTAPPPEVTGAPPTRWGICGAGKISHDFVVALGTLPPHEHRVVAVAARELARAQAFAQHHRVPRAYGSYEELARDPNVDVVYVGTVNPQHAPAARLFLAARRPLLVEKPLGVSAPQVRELAAAARDRGTFLMEGFWTRFFPAWGRLRALVAGGAVGEPLVLRGALAFPLGGLRRLRDPGLGGGALLDLGGYGLQMATALLGGGRPPRRLRAHGCLHPSGVDETVTLTLDYEGGRHAALTVSMAALLPGGAALGGTRGWVEIPSHMNCPTELLVGGEREFFPLPPPGEPLNYPRGTGLRYEAQHVRECLLRGLSESPVMPLAESELIAELLDEARRQVGAAGAPPPKK